MSFGIWLWRWGVTMRLFGRLYQVKLRRDELYSQRMDSGRIRFCGLSLKVGR